MNEKALRVTRQMEALADELWDVYTLKTTFWQDDDFRVLAYRNLKVPSGSDYTKLYAELGYQDSKMPDGRCVHQLMGQYCDSPHNESRQYPAADAEMVELPDGDDD